MAEHKIVISGYYGFNNAGDEAMLLAILQALRKAFDHPRITVISGNPESTADHFHVEAVPRFGFFSILKALMGTDVLISGGGSLLQDVTSWKSMIYYLTIIIVGVLFRKKVFLYSQGIGPVRYRVIRIILKHVLNHVDAITVRDRESKGFLQRLGVKRKIYTTADAVLSLSPVDPAVGAAILRDHTIPAGHKKVGIAIRSWADTDRWMVSFKEYLKRLSEEKDLSIILIPMQFPEDEKLSASLKGLAPNVHVLPGPYTIEELISLMGNMDVVVGMRLHALIFSALMHVPFVGISYDPKIDNFLDLVGERPAASIAHMDGEALYTRTRDLLAHGMDDAVWTAVADLRGRAQENVEILQQVMKK